MDLNRKKSDKRERPKSSLIEEASSSNNVLFVQKL